MTVTDNIKAGGSCRKMTRDTWNRVNQRGLGEADNDYIQDEFHLNYFIKKVTKASLYKIIM